MGGNPVPKNGMSGPKSGVPGPGSKGPGPSGSGGPGPRVGGGVPGRGTGGPSRGGGPGPSGTPNASPNPMMPVSTAPPSGKGIAGPHNARSNFDGSVIEKRTSKLAIASIATALFAPVLGITFGVLAKLRIKKADELKGKKFATWGIVVASVALILQGLFGWLVYSSITEMQERTAATAVSKVVVEEEPGFKYCEDIESVLEDMAVYDNDTVVSALKIMAGSDSPNYKAYEDVLTGAGDSKEQKAFDAAALKTALSEDLKACY